MDPVDIDEIVGRLRARIGFESPPAIREIGKNDIIRFARAIGETNPIYLDEAYAKTTRFGGLVAPTSYASVCAADVLPGELFVFDLPLKRYLQAEDIVRNHRPLRAGDVTTTVGRLADVHTKPGRSGPMLFQCADMTIKNQDDELVSLVRIVSVHF